MSEEREEYTRETYPSFGKKYNSERAIISLTSWKARINTVSKTLFSLIQQCPGFHIVLVLSEEEFPKMCEELPENLMLFVENEMIELMFVYKNYKSFKKVLFTMDKYRDVPVISADDDCIYTCNYAQELYDKWNSLKNKNVVINRRNEYIMSGPHSLYYGLKNIAIDIIKSLTEHDILKSDDDKYIGFYLKKINYPRFCHSMKKPPFIFHDENIPLHNYRENKWYDICYK